MRDVKQLTNNIDVAMSKQKADLVIKNAKVLNVFLEKFEKKDIAISNGYIVGLGKYKGEKEIDAQGKYVVPGFIDGHVHLESSIVSPSQYASVVSLHGTTAVVADPHEITNVLGETGFEYILKSSANLPIDVYLMAPSCVPATGFDENGAVINAKEIEKFFQSDRVLGVAEMMNYVGVVNSDPQVLSKIAVANKYGKIIDGHAPGLSDKMLNAYVTAGVESDHECTNFKEAQEKIALGQWIMIRQGTSCKNLEALMGLFNRPYCYRSMLATDDKHISELKHEGHIDHIVRLAISKGANPILAFKMASFNPATYFGLKHQGAVACGYKADFCILDDMEKVTINSVYKGGVLVDGKCNNNTQLPSDMIKKVTNSVHINPVKAKDFQLKKAKVIGVVGGEILTTDQGYAESIDIAKDICKIAVVERHKNTGHIGLAYIKGYGLKKGAIATTIAHDSHNIIVAGASDTDIAVAVNRLQDIQGGMVVVCDGKVVGELALPIAGLMCDREADEIGLALNNLKKSATLLGVNSNIDPFMTLSFVSLPVIPTLRLLTQGVFDVTQFNYVQ